MAEEMISTGNRITITLAISEIYNEQFLYETVNNMASYVASLKDSGACGKIECIVKSGRNTIVNLKI